MIRLNQGAVNTSLMPTLQVRWVYDEPYFYVSVYPQPGSVALPRLPKLGHWHTHEFTAAVVPAHQIVAANNQKAAADEFLKTAIDVAIKILRRGEGISLSDRQ